MAPKVAAEREVNAMSIRLWRRFKVAPGIRLNLSKSGLSTSFGTHGMWYTIGPRGQRVTAGLPGSGLFVTEKRPAPRRRSYRPPRSPLDPPTWFSRGPCSRSWCCPSSRSGRYSIAWAAFPPNAPSYPTILAGSSNRGGLLGVSGEFHCSSRRFD